MARGASPAGRLPNAAAALALAAAAGCASARGRPPAPAPAPPPPPDARAAFVALADSLLADTLWRTAHWGALVVDPAAGDTLYSRNAGKLFLPASNQKLLTGAAALALLGAEFRWRTTLTATRGALGPDGTLRGDLRVIGRGDPTVSARAQQGDALRPLRALADSLAARGVRRVTGRLVAAGDAFPGDPYGYGWAWDDFDAPYSAGVSELLFNEGAARVVARGGLRPGAPATVEVRAAPATLPLDAAVVTGPAAAGGPGDAPAAVTARYDAARGRYRVEGAVAPGDSAVLDLAIRDPRAAYLAALGDALRARRIRVDGGASGAAGAAAPGAAEDTLATLLSPPLREVLPYLEKPSQNQIAEALFRTVALERTGVGTPDSARAVVGRQLRAWGVVPERDVAVRDGSGLSRHDYVTPEALVRVLAAVRARPDFAAFYDALPVAGVDGTLRARMRGTPAAGNARAKTGTIDRARTLSGYVTAADGRLLVFSLLCNNHTAPTREVDRVQDALVARLAELRAPARAAAPLGGAGRR